MKQFYLLVCTLLLCPMAWGQAFSLNDLVGFTGYTASRFEHSVSKKGYHTADFSTADNLAFTWKSKKETAAVKTIFKCDKADKATIAFETSLPDEFEALSRQLKEEGYYFAEGARSPVYQKGSLTITPLTATENEKTVYRFVIERRALPKAKDIHVAEDFLPLASHEYLAAVFGEGAVKRDQFYFSEHEISPCSVLFPNTSRQLIFIWKDEENQRGIAFLLIGGQLRTQSLQSSHKQVEQNIWQTRQGLYAGMSLRELQKLNGGNLTLYGWQTDQPGVLTEKNEGAINIKQTGVVLDCFDCNRDGYYSDSRILNSEDLLREGRRMYVSTIIVLPDGK